MKNRLLSIDVFRGLTIFFMIIVNTPGSWEYVYAPLRHAAWHGWTPTDLVFPFFVFISGVSMAYSFSKMDQKGILLQKVFRRAFLIFLVGLLLNWYPFVHKSLDQLRIYGVLQRIALAYFVGALIVIYAPRKYIIHIGGFLLIAYWLMLYFGYPVDPFSLEHNLVRKIDLLMIGENHLYKGYGLPFDPEGLLSTLPTSVTILIGYLTGDYIQKQTDHLLKIRRLITMAVLLIVGAYFWHFTSFPINKPIWSSSYVLLTGGLGILLLAVLIYIVDVRQVHRWTYIFQVFGLNPLISYALSGLIIKTLFLVKIGEINFYAWLYTSLFQPLLGNYFGSFMQALVYTMFIWIFAWWLYLNKKVIKL